MVAIDGKTVRRSFDRAGNKGAIHLVSAWSSRQKLVLGARAVDEKSNEITAIPELLDLLAIKGAIVTIDAMGCQKKIAEKIIAKSADYVFGPSRGHRGLFPKEHAKPHRGTRRADFVGAGKHFQAARRARRNRR